LQKLAQMFARRRRIDDLIAASDAHAIHRLLVDAERALSKCD
jgi:hypothetical protein